MWEPFGSYLLNSTANPARFRWKLAGNKHTAPTVFFIFSAWFFSLNFFSTKHFCPRIFDTYYFKYRWCVKQFFAKLWCSKGMKNKEINCFLYTCVSVTSILELQGAEVTCKLGLTLWNLCCLEFKFDDTRLSYWHKNNIGRIEIFFCCFLTLLIFCPVGLLSFAETANRAEN